MAKDNEKKTQLNLLDRIADAVEDIASGGGGGGGGGGGSELPAVTAADNGKVLGVVEGEWAVANAGSGLVVNVAYDESIDTYKADKTWQEIWDATCAGKSVAILYVNNSDPSFILNFAYSPDFVNCEIDGGTTRYRVVYNNGATSLECSDPDDYPVEAS